MDQWIDGSMDQWIDGDGRRERPWLRSVASPGGAPHEVLKLGSDIAAPQGRHVQIIAIRRAPDYYKDM
jgi:hypothetical protein